MKLMPVRGCENAVFVFVVVVDNNELPSPRERADSRQVFTV